MKDKEIKKETSQGTNKKPFESNKGGFRSNKFNKREKDEFDQKIVDLARVTRVTAGGKRMKFRACVAIGDKKASVGVGIGKGNDVTIAINKAVKQAKKNLVKVPIIDGTIPHEVFVKFGSAKVLMRPGKKGNRIKAGGIIKMILDLAGIDDIVAKRIGCSNNINNAQATIKGLQSLRPIKEKVIKDKKKPVSKEKK